MKLSWLRLIVSAMIVIAALSGAATGFAAPVTHSCAAMSAADDCPDHAADRATAPPHCDSLICGALQSSPPQSLALAITREAALARRMWDDAARRGLSSPPDLRPPIS